VKVVIRIEVGTSSRQPPNQTIWFHQAKDRRGRQGLPDLASFDTSLVSSGTHALLEEEDPADEGAKDKGRSA
jgi:hypothetical protein